MPPPQTATPTGGRALASTARPESKARLSTRRTVIVGAAALGGVILWPTLAVSRVEQRGDACAVA